MNIGTISVTLRFIDRGKQDESIDDKHVPSCITKWWTKLSESKFGLVKLRVIFADSNPKSGCENAVISNHLWIESRWSFSRCYIIITIDL